MNHIHAWEKKTMATIYSKQTNPANKGYLQKWLCPQEYLAADLQPGSSGRTWLHLQRWDRRGRQFVSQPPCHTAEGLMAAAATTPRCQSGNTSSHYNNIPREGVWCSSSYRSVSRQSRKCHFTVGRLSDVYHTEASALVVKGAVFFVQRPRVLSAALRPDVCYLQS